MYGFSHAQDSIDANKKVIEYIHNNLGKKIGQGVCVELIFGSGSVQEYLSNIGIKSDSLHSIDSSDVKIGDIILFENVVFSDGSKINHIAVIYDIMPNGRLGIAEQNVKIKKYYRKKKIIYREEKVKVYRRSRVVLAEYDLSCIVSGEIIYCRF